jgi:hypothetical protein
MSNFFFSLHSCFLKNLLKLSIVCLKFNADTALCWINYTVSEFPKLFQSTISFVRKLFLSYFLVQYICPNHWIVFSFLFVPLSILRKLSYFVLAHRQLFEHRLINYNIDMSSSKKIDLCRDFAAGVEFMFIGWRYSQSCGSFRPSFVNYCPSNLLSGSTFHPLTHLPCVKVQYIQTVYG